MLLTLIVACEVGFWVFLLAGLSARYLLRRRRLSTLLLLLAPLVDLVLLVATVLDLRQGGVATVAHVLAAVYLGVSVGFGHRMISAMDVRFAHRFAGGPPPPSKARFGAPHAAAQRAAWQRHVAAWAVGVGLMTLATLAIADPARTEIFVSTALLWTAVLLVDTVVSLSYSRWPKKDPATTAR